MASSFPCAHRARRRVTTLARNAVAAKTGFSAVVHMSAYAAAILLPVDLPLLHSRVRRFVLACARVALERGGRILPSESHTGLPTKTTIAWVKVVESSRAVNIGKLVAVR
jgi:hypothetical protein